MAQFEPVDTTYNFPKMEERILKFWEEKGIFAQSLEKPAPAGEYVFYEGPPTANALPHPGHVLTRVMKDVFPRYKTMMGYHVARKAGWDTHGLPVEIEVERELGFHGKQDIEKYGIRAFNQKCLESVRRYEQEWRRISNRIGFWLRYEDAYFTYTNEYIESVWWLLKQMWDAGLIYQGHKIVPYCYRCGTPLSSHEVAQSYRDTRDPSLYLRFRVAESLEEVSPDLPAEKTSFLVWTTTPWTLISNVALAVNPQAEYVAVYHGGEYLILARELLKKAGLDEEPVIASFPGTDLVGIHYEPLYTYFSLASRAHYVVAGDFVTLDDGTGIVHIAPAFGEEDYQVGQKHNLPFVQAVDEEGNFRSEVQPWAGMNVKKADPQIIDELKERGLLFRAATYKHAYPFCWRCDEPLLYYAFTSWFVRTTAVRERLLANNEKINWVPEHIKHGRFGQWLEGVVDWALSRNRYWGTPLPIWECDSCEHRECIGSYAELAERAGLKVNDFYDRGEFDPHRPFVDEIKWKCPECGGTMHRVPHVIDCWFDSGSMPFAQHHYPFEHPELIDEGTEFPADFISEAIDQTRGWFYTLHAIATMVKDSPAYRNCLVLGHILDERGRKMSKSLGNVEDPWKVLSNQGADAFRWYFLSNTAPWTGTRYSEQAVVNSLQKLLIPLWNVYSFFVIYANIDDFSPQQAGREWRERSELDRWILIKFHRLARAMREHLDAYRVTEAAHGVEEFMDLLSNWYVRRSRRRFWKGSKDEEKWDAYHTLYEVLTGLVKLVAPFVPFVSEEVYQKLVRRFDAEAPESVHLCDYPQPDSEVDEPDLITAMDNVLRVVRLGHAARNLSRIKVRQPLAKITLVTNEPELQQVLAPHLPIIKEELNVKEVVWAADEHEFVHYQVKPNFAKLGPRLGALTPAVAKALSEIDSLNLVAELNETDEVKLEAGGQEVALSRDELEVHIVEKEGTVAQRQGNLLLVLDMEITPQLKREGLSREFINRVQNLRKQLDLDYEQRIYLTYRAEEPVRSAIEEFHSTICGETLALKLVEDKSLQDGAEVHTTQIEGEDVLIRLDVAERGGEA